MNEAKKAEEAGGRNGEFPLHVPLLIDNYLGRGRRGWTRLDLWSVHPLTHQGRR